MKKQIEQNDIPDAREKVIVNAFYGEKLYSELWTIEKLWNYMRNAYTNGNDPLDLMFIPQNEYSLGRAEVFGLYNERKDKYGRL